MSHVILPLGQQAYTPWVFGKTYINVYSLEELCVCFVENVELIDQDIVDSELVAWLDKECDLPQLAHSLYSMVNQQVSAAAFVGSILDYAALYPQETVNRMEQVIRQNASISPYEKQKGKADYLLKEGRYVPALSLYDDLLSNVPAEDKLFCGSILHNMGVAYAKMFLFSMAQDAFEKAYATDGNEESLEQALEARRLHGRSQEYVDYIAKNPDYHAASLEAERRMKQASEQFDVTDENRMLFTLHVCKEEGDSAYYKQVDELTAELKEAYRANVAM